MDSQSELNNIVEDKISGSSLIVKRTLDLLLKSEEHEKIIDRIIEAHPTMAGLRKIKSMEADKDIDAIKAEFQKMDRNTIRAGREIVEHKKWVTISQSLTAEKILEVAQFVYVMKSAPGNEGMETFDYLCLHDIESELVEDASMGQAVSDSDGVLVGADTLLPDGFVNKMGTLPLVLVANYYDKPVYVAASSYKEADDMDIQPPFEFVPAALVDRFISEQTDHQTA